MNLLSFNIFYMDVFREVFFVVIVVKRCNKFDKYYISFYMCFKCILILLKKNKEVNDNIVYFSDLG